MGRFAVDPGSLDDAASTLRAAPGDGSLELAQAIVGDLLAGDGTPEIADVAGRFDVGLPEVTASVCRQSATVAAQLRTAASAYRRAEWLVRVAVAGHR